MKSKWAYKVEYVRFPAFAGNKARMELLEDVLGRQGLNSWELTTVTPSPPGLILYFKKPV